MDTIELICFIIFMSICFLWIVFSEWYRASNTLPYGNRAIKKFIKKVETICSVTANDGPIELKYNNKTFMVKCIDEAKQRGLEYSTIPRYKSKLLYINDEPVCRVHYFENFKKHTGLEFTLSRERDEIVELVDATYMIAEIKYMGMRAKELSTTKPSFYD